MESMRIWRLPQAMPLPDFFRLAAVLRVKTPG
jgi:hypothetical protein